MSDSEWEILLPANARVTVLLRNKQIILFCGGLSLSAGVFFYCIYDPEGIKEPPGMAASCRSGRVRKERNRNMMTNQQWLRYGTIDQRDACGIGAVVDIRGRKSHQTVDDALKIVERLEHRTGKDALGQTGDGVGILLQICHGFFSRAAADLEISLGGAGDYAVGMFFFPTESLKRRQAKKMLEVILQKEGMELLGWRGRLPDWNSTGSCTWRDGNSNSPTTTPTW